VTNTRDPGKPEMTSMDQFIGTEFRSRYVNPTWITGMKKEGYAGAGATREFVEYLWGWNATVPETVDGAMWKETFDTYVEDKKNLGLKEFFAQSSPYAYQDMTGRMVETVRKGYWNADAATKTKLLSEYLESVNAHGTSGADFTTGNARLSKYVVEQAHAAGIPVPAIEGFERAMERAMGASIAKSAKVTENFVARNEAPARPAAQPPQGPDAREREPQVRSAPAPGGAATAGQMRGYVMEQQDRTRSTAGQPVSLAGTPQWAAAGVTLPVLVGLIAWRRRHRRR
jgi:cobaltochelatase CobN